MQSDFEMIVHKFPDAITVYPVSDVHYGSEECREKQWREFLRSVAETPNVYVTLGGDLINNGLKNSVTNVYSEKVRPREQKRDMVEMLTPIKDRILCAVPGNHERRSAKEADDEPVYDMMCELGLENLYRPNMAFMKIQIGERNEHLTGTRPVYMIGVTHGAGGGALTGSAVNRNERFGNVIDGLDALVVGHSHKPIISQPQKIVVNAKQNVVSFKPYKMVIATSWTGYGGYALRSMMLPASIGMQTMVLKSRVKELTVTM